MHRIDAADHVGNLFSEGDPATGTPGTKVSDDWLNAVQEEIAHTVEAAGLALDKANNGQLAAVIAATLATAKAHADALRAAAPPAWTGVADPANWNTFGTTYSPLGTLGAAYLKAYGIVHTHVALKRNTAAAYTSGDTIVTLPAGHRPRTEVPVLAALLNGNTGARSFADATIGSNGNVRVHTDVQDGTWVVLQASFPAFA
jgi:hypothetical protein